MSVLLLTIDLAPEVTDEQQEAFWHLFKCDGGKSIFAFVKAEAGVATHTTQSFVSTLRERLGDDGQVILIPAEATVKANIPPVPLMN